MSVNINSIELVMLAVCFVCITSATGKKKYNQTSEFKVSNKIIFLCFKAEPKCADNVIVYLIFYFDLKA